MKKVIIFMSVLTYQSVMAGLIMHHQYPDEGYDDVPSLLRIIADRDIERMQNFLREHPDEVNSPVDNWNQTPLFYAVADNNPEIVASLLQAGANVNHQEFFGSTPLAVAAFYGYYEVAQKLLEHDARVDLKNDEGRNPVEVAYLEGRNEMAQFLEGVLLRQQRALKLSRTSCKKFFEKTFFMVGIKAALWTCLMWLYIKH